jgi:hypothetical protein
MGPRNALENPPLAVLATIGTGLGGLAFFTFMGGAITVARFRGAGLSGTKAVALVPTSDLLASGAQALLAPTVVALILVVFFVRLARHRMRRQVALGVLALLGLGGGIAKMVTRWPVLHTPGEAWWVLGALFAIALAGLLAVDELAKAAEIPKLGAAGVVAVPGRRPAPPPAPRPAGSQAPATMLLFLVIALLVAVAGYGLAYAHPTVHPMAILRANGQSGLSGIYVGESDSRVWIGKVRLDPNDSNRGLKPAGRIIELPRSEVSDIAIGASLPLRKALSEGPCLLRALRREHARAGQRARGSPCDV